MPTFNGIWYHLVAWLSHSHTAVQNTVKKKKGSNGVEAALWLAWPQIRTAVKAQTRFSGLVLKYVTVCQSTDSGYSPAEFSECD